MFTRELGKSGIKFSTMRLGTWIIGGRGPTRKVVVRVVGGHTIFVGNTNLNYA